MAEANKGWAVCSVCGKERSRRQCCERGKARYRALSPEQKKELAMKRKQAKPKKVKGAKEPKHRSELVRVAAEAKQHGMSYGEYVATGGRRNNG
jgi:hypothetical protein